MADIKTIPWVVVFTDGEVITVEASDSADAQQKALKLRKEKSKNE